MKFTKVYLHLDLSFHPQDLSEEGMVEEEGVPGIPHGMSIFTGLQIKQSSCMLYKVNGLKRPSEYLRGRCPLCFGGESWQQPDEMYLIYFE